MIEFDSVSHETSSCSNISSALDVVYVASLISFFLMNSLTVIQISPNEYPTILIIFG